MPPTLHQRTVSKRVHAWHWTLVGSLALLVALSSFATGLLVERHSLNGSGGPFDGLDVGSLSTDSDHGSTAQFARLREVKHLIEEEYFYYPSDEATRANFEKKLDTDAMSGIRAALAIAATPAATPRPDPSLDMYLASLEYEAIQGMTAGLGDDYTTFLEPVEQAPVAQQMSGEYEGIGVWVQYPEGKLTIVSPIPGSPAEKAGIRSGDVIEAADGINLAGVSEEDALNIIRGPTGSSVRLTVRRAGVVEPLTIDVKREKISVPAVTYTFRPTDRVATIQVTVFGDKTTAELDEALGRARQDKAIGLVLDLRNNGGGWVNAAQEMIGRFVPEDRGPAMYEDDDQAQDNDLRSEPIIAGDVNEFEIPLVVLVNGGTASASEIVAGALRHYERAELVGEPTFGKGSVQRIHDFSDGSSFRITIASWLTPDKQPIPEVGLEPDIAVGPSDDRSDPIDEQMERAVDAVLTP